MPFGEEVMANVGGRTTTQGYAGNDGMRNQFTGYERDVESGLDYAQARYYKSRHGRFTSVDPLAASANIKNPQTFNRYNYGLNSPYKFTDPLGLALCDASVKSCTKADDFDTQYSEEEAEFAKIDKESLHLIVIDNALSHTTEKLKVAENIIFIFLPANASELNEAGA